MWMTTTTTTTTCYDCPRCHEGGGFSPKPPSFVFVGVWLMGCWDRTIREKPTKPKTTEPNSTRARETDREFRLVVRKYCRIILKFQGTRSYLVYHFWLSTYFCVKQRHIILLRINSRHHPLGNKTVGFTNYIRRGWAGLINPSCTSVLEYIWTNLILLV